MKLFNFFTPPTGADMQQRQVALAYLCHKIKLQSYKAISYIYLRAGNISLAIMINPIYRVYFVSFAVTNWIDLFIRNEYREEILKSIRYCPSDKDLELYGLYSDCYREISHVHLILSAQAWRTRKTFAKKLAPRNYFTSGQTKRCFLTILMPEFSSIIKMHTALFSFFAS